MSVAPRPERARNRRMHGTRPWVRNEAPPMVSFEAHQSTVLYRFLERGFPSRHDCAVHRGVPGVRWNAVFCSVEAFSLHHPCPGSWLAQCTPTSLHPRPVPSYTPQQPPPPHTHANPGEHGQNNNPPPRGNDPAIHGTHEDMHEAKALDTVGLRASGADSFLKIVYHA